MAKESSFNGMKIIFERNLETSRKKNTVNKNMGKYNRLSISS